MQRQGLVNGAFSAAGGPPERPAPGPSGPGTGLPGPQLDLSG